MMITMIIIVMYTIFAGITCSHKPRYWRVKGTTEEKQQNVAEQAG
jgi:hypothetical protein